MKFSCTQENLKRGLSLVSPIAAKSPHLPILSHIMLKADAGMLTVLGTNLEIGVTTTIRGKVEGVGQCVVPAQVFTNYVSLISGDRVDCSLEGTELIITSGSQHSKIRSADVTEFPLLPTIDKSRLLSVPRQELLRALEHVLPCVAGDDTRPELTGVYMSLQGSVLMLASTDSYRLAEYKLPVAPTGLTDLKVIVPGKSLTEVYRIFSSVDAQQVEVVFADNQAMFRTEEVELLTRLIEGRFPEYQQIIPTQFNTTALVNTEDLKRACKAASLFTKSGMNDVHLKFDTERKQITISAANNQLGENVSGVDAETSGQENSIVFNFRYLLDGISSVKSNKVKVSLIDANNPALFVPEEASEQLYILMPIKQ